MGAGRLAFAVLRVQASKRTPMGCKESMKIGITCYPTYSGSGVVATELGIELASLGHEVHFISYSQPFRLTGRDTGISEYLREKTLADFGVTRDIAVVPNFVNCNVYDFIRDEAVRDDARRR